MLHSVLCGTVTTALTVAESPTFSPQLKSDKEKHDAGLGHPSLLLLQSFENVGVLGGESGEKRINPETPSSSSEVVKKAHLLCCSVVMTSSLIHYAAMKAQMDWVGGVWKLRKYCRRKVDRHGTMVSMFHCVPAQMPSVLNMLRL